MRDEPQWMAGAERRRLAVLAVALGEQRYSPARLRRAGIQDARGAVGPHPPQRVPVGVVVVVGEQRDARVPAYVVEPPERRRALALRVDRADDRVAADREHDGHEMRAAGRIDGGEPCHPRLGEQPARLLGGHTREPSSGLSVSPTSATVSRSWTSGIESVSPSMPTSRKACVWSARLSG